MSKRKGFFDRESRPGQREDVVPDSPYLDPDSAAAPAAGGPSDLFNVITLDNPAEWTAASDSEWIQVENPTTPTTGDTSVQYAVAANDGDARTGSITIAGLDLTFTVNQDASTDPASTRPQQPPETPEEVAKRKSPVDWTSQ